MRDSDQIAYFYLLKEEVAKIYLGKNPACTKKIHDWTGEEIKNFQDDLAELLHERLSERWFYTHLKPRVNEKLPRIDMLNMLARYVGSENWDDFRLTHKIKTGQSENQAQQKRVFKKGYWIAAAVVMMLVVVVFSWMQKDSATKSLVVCEFCFYDADSKAQLEEKAQIEVLNAEESPIIRLTDEKGCISLSTTENRIRFVVKAPYYKTDTIERKLMGEPCSERIELRRDDYALMILYFATSAHLDWEKRRAQLDGMIDDEAIIFQISETNTGMEMYNKTDFINKLTTPLKSLGDIEIVETVYRNDKIITMRFMQL